MGGKVEGRTRRMVGIRPFRRCLLAKTFATDGERNGGAARICEPLGAARVRKLFNSVQFRARTDSVPAALNLVPPGTSFRSRFRRKTSTQRGAARATTACRTRGVEGRPRFERRNRATRRERARLLSRTRPTYVARGAARMLRGEKKRGGGRKE